MKRREFLRSAGATAALLPASGLLAACGGGDDTELGPDGGLPDADAARADAARPSDWASGTTELITSAFPDDDIFGGAQACVLTAIGATTLGPCYFEDATGEDISTGRRGLPMQLCLQLVDEGCQPLAGYRVEVWHCDAEGRYSGDTSESPNADGFALNFCTGGDAEAAESTWYRGQRITDASGRVNFLTCFPGWYPGRTIHFHLRISNEKNTEAIISQLCFPDALARDICTTHPLYLARGEQDTPLAGGEDSVFPDAGIDTYTLETQKNSDDTLLAWKRIRIESAQ